MNGILSMVNFLFFLIGITFIPFIYAKTVKMSKKEYVKMNIMIILGLTIILLNLVQQ